jgi:hypothetical protein
VQRETSVSAAAIEIFFIIAGKITSKVLFAFNCL